MNPTQKESMKDAYLRMKKKVLGGGGIGYEND